MRPYPPMPAGPTSSRRMPGLALLAAGAAGLALLLAVVSMLVSLRAISVADEARSPAARQATPVQPAQPPDAASVPSTSPTSEGSDTGQTPEEPPLNPQTQYTVAYQKEELRLLTGSCSSMSIDLDEPRVNVSSSVSDLQFTSSCSSGPPTLEVDEATAATAETATLTPNDCAQRIRTGPLGDNTTVPVRQGVVMCIVTSRANARTQGIPQKLVLLQVRAVGSDGTVNVLVTAWDIPK